LDSTNGTRVNSERIAEQKLRRNDVIRFGNIELLYDSEYAAPAQALPEPSSRVRLDGCSSKGRPASFANSSPFPKGSGSKGGKLWLYLLLAGALICVGGIGYFAYTVFVAGA
jgi:hypothetical protein